MAVYIMEEARVRNGGGIFVESGSATYHKLTSAYGMKQEKWE
jgi:hypothetical protein